MYLKCQGAPVRTQGQPEPHRAKVIRRMTKGLVPPGHRGKWPNARDATRIEPQPLVVTVDDRVVYARGYEEPSAQALWRQRDVREAKQEEARKIEEKKREVIDRLGIRRRINHYLPDESDGGSAGWIIAAESETIDEDEDTFAEEGLAVQQSSEGGASSSMQPPRRSAPSQLTSQPAGKKRRVLAFSTDVEVAENRRRKMADKDFLQAAGIDSGSSSSSGIRSSLMPPPHPTAIDEAMATAAVGEGTDEVEIHTECIRVHEEPTLTQMVEEGLEDAAEEEDDDVPAA